MSKVIRFPYDPAWRAEIGSENNLSRVSDSAAGEQRLDAARYVWLVETCQVCGLPRACCEGGVCDD